jgi:formylglycine-generating enzyme required for sulfatase activity
VQVEELVTRNSSQTPMSRFIHGVGDEGGQFFFIASSGAVVDQPGPATLSVESNVAGASVRIDGKKIGTTPLIDIPVSPGQHRVWVEKEGYESYRKHIDLEHGRSLSLYVDLSRARPQKARLFVETGPEDAKVRILNIGTAFYQGIELAPNRYHVEVSSNGYKTKDLWVTLHGGEDKNLNIRLKPALTATKEKSFTNAIGMEFAYISPDTFLMGSPSSEKKRGSDERQHEVSLTKGFYLQTTEVTQRQWREIMGNNPSAFKNCGDDCPVERVSWHDCQEFIGRLNEKEGTNKYRLPTEAEWEYACRAGTKAPFSTGQCLATNQANYDGNYPMPGCPEGEYRKRTVRAGSFPPNPWGLYDMHGNVWEWCQDWYEENYPSGHVTDPEGPTSGAERVLRGGGWYGDVGFCRSADRRKLAPGLRKDVGIGFRVARDL